MSERVDYSRYSPAGRSTRSRVSIVAFLDTVNAERIGEMVEERSDSGGEGAVVRQVRELEQDELFGDLWIQRVTVDAEPDEAIAD